MSSLTQYIITLDGFWILLDCLESIFDTNHVFPTNIINIDTYFKYNIKSKIIKCKKTNNTSFVNKNWKRATKRKRNPRNKETGKLVNKGKKTVVNIVNDSMVKDVYVWDLSVINEKIIVKHFRGSTRDDRKTQLTTMQHWSWSCSYSYR